MNTDSNNTGSGVTIVAQDTLQEYSNTVFGPISGTFTVPAGGAEVDCFLEVDDWGTLTITGPGGGCSIILDDTQTAANPDGGHEKWSGNAEAFLEEGTYSYTITHQNITMDYEENNLAYLSYRITLSSYGGGGSTSSSSSSSGIINGLPPRDEEICCNSCTCAGEEGNEYSSGSEGLPDDALNSDCSSNAEYEPQSNPASRSRMRPRLCRRRRHLRRYRYHRQHHQRRRRPALQQPLGMEERVQ